MTRTVAPEVENVVDTLSEMSIGAVLSVQEAIPDATEIAKPVAKMRVYLPSAQLECY